MLGHQCPVVFKGLNGSGKIFRNDDALFPLQTGCKGVLISFDHFQNLIFSSFTH